MKANCRSPREVAPIHDYWLDCDELLRTHHGQMSSRAADLHHTLGNRWATLFSFGEMLCLFRSGNNPWQVGQLLFVDHRQIQRCTQ